MVKCSVCGREFKNQHGLAIHLARGGCALLQAVCDQCGKAYVVEPRRRSAFLKQEHHFCSRECGKQWTKNHRYDASAECEWCGKEYQLTSYRKRNSKHHFCSTACYHAWQGTFSTMIQCAQCGKVFKASRSQIAAGKRFCSLACLGKANGEARRGAAGPGWRGGPETIICKACGKEFRNEEHRYPSPSFCSQQCANGWRSGTNSPAWKGGKPSITCLNCGKEFKDLHYGLSRFCSLRCSFLYSGRTKNEEAIAAFLAREGIPFEEQYPIPDSRFIADFLIAPCLIIETDAVHWHDKEKDEARDAWLEAHDYQVMRLDYCDVINTDAWKTLILDAISAGVL